MITTERLNDLSHRNVDFQSVALLSISEQIELCQELKDRRAKDAKVDEVACVCIPSNECGTASQCQAHNDGWKCTRKAGHDGEHVACVIGCGKPIHKTWTWRNEAAKPPVAVVKEWIRPDVSDNNHPHCIIELQNAISEMRKVNS